MERLLICFLLGASASSALVLDEYVSKAEPNYAWFDTGARVTGMPGGATAHILNVTSLQWLSTDLAYGPTGNIWTHQVAVVVPKNIAPGRSTAMAVLTGGCNEGHSGNGTDPGPDPPSKTEEYLEVASIMASSTQSIAIVVYQLPNCPIIYPSDPLGVGRTEDAMIAWAWNQYLTTPNATEEWLPHLPMTKAAMQAMRAAQEYTSTAKVTTISDWLVGGASKRGWTSWLVGAVQCASCVKIRGLFPMVPIVPALDQCIHRQFQSIGGYTWAFKDYLESSVLSFVETPAFKRLLQVVDPINYVDRLVKLPILVMVSSNDEFMQFDWTNIWYDVFDAAARGANGSHSSPHSLATSQLSTKLSSRQTFQTGLFIIPNSEHSLATGIPGLVLAIEAFALAIFENRPLPTLEYSHDPQTGLITVRTPASFPPTKVVLRHTSALREGVSDFRWISKVDNVKTHCKFPKVPIPPVAEGGGNCLMPMVWHEKTLNATEPGSDGYVVYQAKPPTDPFGRYVGYYVELYFEGEGKMLSAKHRRTTPGFVWPSQLPYPDCNGVGCPMHVV